MDNSILAASWDWQDPEYADYGALFDLSEVETESFPEDPDLFALAAADDGLADELPDPFTLEDDGLADLAEHPASNLTHEERDRLTLARIEADLALYYGWPTPSRIPAPATRDHWGDAFSFLGEPTEAELLPDPEGQAAALERGRQAAKRKRRRKPVTASPGCWRLSAHLVDHESHYPDEVNDTRANRWRDSRKVAAVLHQLAARYPEGLKVYRLSLPELDELDLYDPELVKRAKKTVARWLKARGVRGWLKVERGRNGGTHAHIVTSAAADSSIGEDVYDINGLAAYFVKPPNARACMPRLEDKQRYSPAELKRQKDEAAEHFLSARAALAPGRNLPRFHESCTPRGVR